MLKNLPLFLLAFCWIVPSASGKDLELPDFKPDPSLPVIEPQKGPEAIKPMTGPEKIKPQTGPGNIKLLPALPSVERPSKEKIVALKAGDTIPNVTLFDLAGEPVSLPHYIFGEYSLIIFYRGSWCPYCNMHLKEIKEVEAPIIGLGYRVIAVSPDKPEILRETIEDLKPAYILLSDSSMSAAKAFGIAFTVDGDTIEKYKKHDIDLQKASGRSHHMLPKPSVFLVGPQGIIRYSFSSDNYKIRIKADELLKQANAHYRPVF